MGSFKIMLHPLRFVLQCFKVHFIQAFIQDTLKSVKILECLEWLWIRAFIVLLVTGSIEVLMLLIIKWSFVKLYSGELEHSSSVLVKPNHSSQRNQPTSSG